MQVKAVIFDIGGVLVRTEDLEPRRRWERRFGLPDWGLAKIVFDSPVAAAATIGQTSLEAVWVYVQHKLSLAPAELTHLRQDFLAGDRYDVGLLSYIRSLRGRYKTGIISNAWPQVRQMHHAHINLQTFDVILYSAEEGVAKPAAEIYQRALARLGVAANESVFVDDVLENIQAAQALGMAGVHFNKNVDVRAEFEKLGIQ